MISIIVSSYQPEFFSSLERSIEDTCGVEYELIRIQNNGVMSIAEAYNLGASKAKFDNLLFIHEDIIFHSKNWGVTLLRYLNNENTGMIGVAGGSYVTSAPCGWCSPKTIYNHHSLIQNNSAKNSPRPIFSIDGLTEVKALDGVFLAIKKDVFQLFLFDTDIKGFHGYDISTSLRVAKFRQNYVVPDIIIEHFSEGKTDEKWLDAIILVRKKLGANFNQEIDKETEATSFIEFLNKYLRYKPVNAQTIFKTLQFFPLSKLRIADYYKILKLYSLFIVYKK